jgi:hypothetical protein
MKYLLTLVFLTIALAAWARRDFGYLKPEDQTYYKNESMAGMNQMERIDSTVKEINKLHGEINQLKKDLALLQAEVEKLKGDNKK